MLDTNMLSELVRDRHGAIGQKVLAAGVDNVCTSIVSACELRYGALKSGALALRRGTEELLGDMEIMPLEQGDDEVYAKLRHAITRAGTPLQPTIC